MHQDFVKNDYQEFRRLFFPLIMKNSADQSWCTAHQVQLRAFWQADVFAETYANTAIRRAMLDLMRQNLLTTELVEDHSELQEILFPTVVNSLNGTSAERQADLLLNLYTYPETLAAMYPDRESRKKLIEGLSNQQANLKSAILTDAKILVNLMDSPRQER